MYEVLKDISLVRDSWVVFTINYQQTETPSEQPVETVSKEVAIREDYNAKSASNFSSIRLAQTTPSPETWTPRCIEMLSHDQ
jgi:hypothetical protein